MNNEKTNLAEYDNSDYNPGNVFKRVCWFVVNTLFFKSSLIPFYSFKRFLLRIFGAKIGKAVVIKPGVSIKYPWLLQVGNYCWIGENVWIDNLANVQIGDHVCVSQGAFLFCGNHNFKKKGFDLMLAPIMLDDGVWIGSKAIVCPGTVCNSHAVLTVGSVAVGILEAYSIYRGNPALKLKDRIIK